MAKEKILEHIIEIKEKQKYYDFYKKLPKIIFWVTVAFYGIIGIVLSNNIRHAGTGPFFVSLLIGLVVGAISYFLIKILASVKIIQTEYLAIIAKEVAEEEQKEGKIKGVTKGWVCPKCGKGNVESTIFCVGCGASKPSKNYSNVDEKEDLRPRWTCKECGYSNNPAAKACANCGKPKI